MSLISVSVEIDTSQKDILRPRNPKGTFPYKDIFPHTNFRILAELGKADPTASRSARPTIVDGRRGESSGSMGKPEVAPGPRETKGRVMFMDENDQKVLLSKEEFDKLMLGSYTRGWNSAITALTETAMSALIESNVEYAAEIPQGNKPN